MTATTISLVLAASIYAYYNLEQQRGVAEFKIAQRSILAFDDALENVAWKPNATLSTRFTIQYGELRLIPDTSSYANNVTIVATVGNDTITIHSNQSGLISYYIKNRFITYGDGYKSYILGNETGLLVGSTGSYGRAVVIQQAGWVNTTLDYRVRAMLTSRIDVNGTFVNYLDVWVIRIELPETLDYYAYYAYTNDFDLKARCLRVRTTSWGPYEVNGGGARLNVTVGSSPMSSAYFAMDSGDDVVFNVRVATVRVYA